jgi:hypothetical protein
MKMKARQIEDGSWLGMVDGKARARRWCDRIKQRQKERKNMRGENHYHAKKLDSQSKTTARWLNGSSSLAV